jgi:N-methylhydantoinase A
VPFGGAAGLHAIGVAEELDMRRVLFPADASTLSARGILFADIAHDFAETRLLTASPANLPEFAAMVARLRAAGTAVLTRDGVSADRQSLELLADMRYRGQAYEILVPWAGAVDEQGLGAAIATFHATHLERFAHQDEGETPEIVTLRLVARGLLPKAEAAEAAAGSVGAQKGVRQVDGREVPIYSREAIGDEWLDGPMVIEEAYTTLLLPGGWRIHAVGTGHLLAEKVQ